MTRVLHRDYETRSLVDLRKCGAHVYFEDHTTDVWCCSYCVDEGPVKLWIPGNPVPEEFTECAKNPEWLAFAHNNNFERLCETYLMQFKYDFPLIPLERQRCTMQMAAAMSLPQSLENLGAALGLEIQKDMSGRALMLRMARPRKRLENGELQWWDEPERLQKLYRYCETDTEVEREVHKRLLPLRPFEQEVSQLDAVINDRGIQVDVDLCERAKAIVSAAQARLNKEMLEATDYEVGGTSKVQELIRWLRTRGVQTDSVAKEELNELLLRADLPDDARRALEIRQEAGLTSVSKIDALLRGRSLNGRACGLLAYHAASTGRWAGRRFQPQNLRRQDEDVDVDAAIEAILGGASAKTIEALFGPPLTIVGNTLRGMVTAAPGNKLIAADYSNIEGRVLAWLAGEQWKLDAFVENDQGRAPDLYIQSYCKTFGVPLFGKTDPRRKVGKVMELASGYQGGHGAYLKMGAKGKLLDSLTTMTRGSTDGEVWEKAAEKFNGAFGLSHDQWTALRVVIDGWRAAHPLIYRFWFDLEDAAADAVGNPGKAVPVGALAFKKAGSFLFLRLPSGRCLVYPYPRLETVKTPWGADKEIVIYKGVDSRTTRKLWGDIYTYGGLWAENVTQAVARDLLAEGILRVERAGYPVVMHVHDEIVSEVAKGFGSVETFENLMAELPEWAAGLPVAAAGWEGKRYRK